MRWKSTAFLIVLIVSATLFIEPAITVLGVGDGPSEPVNPTHTPENPFDLQPCGDPVPGGPAPPGDDD